jgi:hypothetical protein
MKHTKETKKHSASRGKTYKRNKEKNTFGKSGLMERSIIRPVRISLSEAPISRRKWFVGIRPAAAAFCLQQQML